MATEDCKRRGKHCSVYDCNNSLYDKNGELSGLHFFKFPMEPAKVRERWCNLIKRQHKRAGFQVTPNTVVCEVHFNEEDIKKTPGGGRWTLKNGAEPSVFSWTSENIKARTLKRAPPKERKIPFSEVKVSNKKVPKCDTALKTYCDASVQTDININCFLNFTQDMEKDASVRLTSQLRENPSICFVDSNFFSALHGHVQELENQLQECMKKIEELQEECESFNERQFSLEKIKNDNDAMLFYTGFPNYNTFISFFQYLEPKLDKLHYWTGEKSKNDNISYQENVERKKPGSKRKLIHMEEFFIVMLRLKAGLFVQDIADRFNISVGLVSKIVITWINLLYLELQSIFPYPSQDLVRKNMPNEFCEYPTTRIILDCTEIFIQRPSAMLAQSQTWSDYKHHNTLKALVGISPNGQVTYVSNLWGGRASDKLIVKECGILNLLEPGDNVMVDRGFEIEELVPAGVFVNMPPFLGSRQQMTANETEKTMKIASLRIHVERAIGRIKTYHILDGNLPISLTPYVNQIFTVCSLLTNFLPPLLSRGNNA